MAGPDILLFCVGAVLFGGATYAILQQDGGLGGEASALGVFTVTYDAETVEVGSEAAASLRAASAEFAVNETNVLTVIVDVACSGATGDVGPAAFQLQVSVAGPNGLAGEGTGSCASGASVPIEVAVAPESGTAPGTTEAEAREALPPLTNSTLANGAWTVDVTGARQGAPTLPVPVADPAGTIRLSVERAEPRFTAVQR